MTELSQDRDREEASRDNQMLVERDGRYELLDAYDATAQTQEGDDSDVGVSSGLPLPQTREVQPTENHQQAQSLKGQDAERKKEAGQASSEKLHAVDWDIGGDHDRNGASVRSTSAMKNDSVLSAVSTYALNGEKTVSHISTSVRTKSAPGMRSGRLGQDEHKKRNEVAFSAWLASKNEELVRRRQMEKQEYRIKEEKLMHKQSLNEAAYQAWLERKTTELRLKRRSTSRPTTSIPKVDEAAKQAAFEAWLDSKREQHRKKVEVEREKRSQAEEKAKNSDPTLVEQAYKKLVSLFILILYV